MPGLLASVFECVEQVRAQVCSKHHRAIGGQTQRYGATVALAGAGHDSDLVLKGFILI